MASFVVAISQILVAQKFEGWHDTPMVGNVGITFAVNISETIKQTVIMMVATE